MASMTATEQEVTTTDQGIPKGQALVASYIRWRTAQGEASITPAEQESAMQLAFMAGYASSTSRDQATIDELARHNQELTHRLFAEEERVKVATREAERYRLESESHENVKESLRLENERLRKLTVEQAAEITAAGTWQNRTAHELHAAEQRALEAEKERDDFSAGADAEARAGDEARAEAHENSLHMAEGVAEIERLTNQISEVRRVVDEDIPRMLTALRDIGCEELDERGTDAMWMFEGQAGHRIKTLLSTVLDKVQAQ